MSDSSLLRVSDLTIDVCAAGYVRPLFIPPLRSLHTLEQQAEVNKQTIVTLCRLTN